MNDTDDCHAGAGGGPAPATSSMTQWRKNQLAVTVSASFVFFGFTLVMPFLPIYSGNSEWKGLAPSRSGQG